ncbi:MAG: glycosyltransferase family 4 protein [Acidobacteriota bacterium]
MRLLIVNYEYPPVGGGASNASWFLAKALVGQGHAVSVVTSAFEDYRGLKVEEEVRVHRIPALRKKIDSADMRQMRHFVASALAYAPFIVRRDRIEGMIIYFTLPSGLVGYWLKILFRLPYLVSLQGGDVPGLIPELDRTHHRLRWPRRRILRAARAVVANSQGLADVSAKTDPVPVAVVPNGVDCTLFHPAAESETDPERPFRIFFAGRLQKQKNLEVLLDAVARLKRDGLTDFELDIAGDGPLGPATRQYAADLGLADDITWHGWLAKPELIAQYRRADCFVNPSLYEGLPNTVTEAMACGLPVVASRVIGNDELVTDQATGLLFDLAQPRQLGEALARLMHDRAAAQRMGAAGRALVLADYSWEAAAEAYVRLLRGARAGAVQEAAPLHEPRA